MADPQTYLDEASRIRREAADITDTDILLTMLTVADMYEKLAIRVAKRLEDGK